MSHFITALDIGSAQVKGLIAERKPNGLLSVIAAFKQPSFGFKKGVLVDIEEATHFLRELVLDLKRIHKDAHREVFVNVNSEHVRSRLSRGIAAVSRADQEIREEDVERVLQASRALKTLPNHQVLHNITREFFVDEVGDIHDPIGMTGNRLEVSTLVIEMFSPQLTLLTKALERVGVGLGGLIFNPLAASRAVLSKQQRDLGALFVDFGFGTTSFAVFEEGRALYTRSLPLGSSHLTNDLAVGLKISAPIAEKLKLMYGSALSRDISRRDMIRLSEFDPTNSSEVSRRFLVEIIEARLLEIFQLIQAELKKLQGNIQLPGGVVLSGGGAKLPGLSDFVRQELKLSVQIGLPHPGLFEIANPSYEDLIDDSEFAVAAGLLLWGALESKPSFNGLEMVKSFFRNLIP